LISLQQIPFPRIISIEQETHVLRVEHEKNYFSVGVRAVTDHPPGINGGISVTPRRITWTQGGNENWISIRNDRTGSTYDSFDEGDVTSPFLLSFLSPGTYTVDVYVSLCKYDCFIGATTDSYLGSSTTKYGETIVIP